MPKRVFSGEIEKYRAQLLVPWVKDTIEGDDLTRLKGLLRTLDDFICGSYRLESNPLPHLRKCFPDFIWRFQKPKDIGEVISIVLKHDYTFAISDCEDGLLTALEKGNSFGARKVYYTDEDHLTFPEALESLDAFTVLGSSI